MKEKSGKISGKNCEEHFPTCGFFAGKIEKAKKGDEGRNFLSGAWSVGAGLLRRVLKGRGRAETEFLLRGPNAFGNVLFDLPYP